MRKPTRARQTVSKSRTPKEVAFFRISWPQFGEFFAREAAEVRDFPRCQCVVTEPPSGSERKPGSLSQEDNRFRAQSVSRARIPSLSLGGSVPTSTPASARYTQPVLSPRSGRMKIAQRFSAGTSGRTGPSPQSGRLNIEWQSLARNQPSALRTAFLIGPVIPTDESVGSRMR